MKVSQLRLTNFRGITELAVDFTECTTAFVGVNGVGKSTVLDALAIGLSQMAWRIIGSPQKARPIAVDDIHVDSDFARIEITAVLNGRPVTWATVTNRKKGSYNDPLRKSDLDALNECVRGVQGDWSQQSIDDRPLAVFYDVHRAVLDVPMRVREKLTHNVGEIYQDALDHGGADFKRFFIWFRNFEDAENEVRTDDPSFRYHGLEAARKAILTFTGFEGVRVRRKPKMRMTVQKNNSEFNVLQLSDGERNMLALVGDMARRLSVLNPSLENPNEGSGIVIIDEIDLHLHPGWQREVVRKLEFTFPNCQFFISTHSPQVIGELLPESVMLLKGGQLLGHARRAIGLSSGEVLEELMGETARNRQFQSDVNLIERAIEDERFEEARVKLKEVLARFGSLPEVLRLEESLEWFDPTEKVDAEKPGHGDWA